MKEVEGWPSEGVTCQNSCTSTVLGSSCLCRHHVSILTVGAVGGAGGEGQGGPWRPDWVLMAAPSLSPPTYPVVWWSAPGWGSSCSSGQAGASGCSASAGRRLWMGGARIAHTGGSWRAGRPPGGGDMALSLNLCALRCQLNLPCPQPAPPQSPEVALRLTRSQLASPSRGWWRSSHF